MGATLFRKHAVFKMDLGLQDASLFGGGETVCVASLHCEKNCYPHSYKWDFEFIGSVDLFQDRYLPETAYFFDDGLSQASYMPTGAAFTKHLKERYAKAGPLTVAAMQGMDWYGYSWSDTDVQLLTERAHLKEFTYYLGTRHAARVDDAGDIEKMVREAYQIIATSERVWLGRLWGLSASQVAELARVPDQTQFLTVA